MQECRKTLSLINSHQLRGARVSDPHLHETQDGHCQGEPHHTREDNGDDAKSPLHP